jgi:hypothetical protein
MATPKLRDLDSYVKPAGRICGTCASEHRAFIDQAYEAGYNATAITRYLNDRFNAGLIAPAVRWHFREGHHGKKANAKRS